MALRRSSPTDMIRSALLLSATLVGRGLLSVWRQVKWQPPLKRTHKRPITLAWKTALRWMIHIQKERDRLKTRASQLQMANALCSIEPRQCSVLLQAFSEVSGFLRNARRSQVVLQQLPSEVQSFLGSGLQ
eukprot:4199662-Pyramimonas_sp.AAC.1